MRLLVADGKTISSEVISLNVKGPGLQRMVLIDLPGIISTVTTGMDTSAKDVIRQLARHYLENPNSIILCIQDGSIDAERSNVTDLVSSIDPQGERTIFVLTKVDKAEENLHNPGRIKQVLEGKLFPMKALGYYAVVAGSGSHDESIEQIREYEAKFFRNSRLFLESTLSFSQMTTENLSKAVSERFWKMVKNSVEHQMDIYRGFLIFYFLHRLPSIALRLNLETEWKNSFPHLRQMDREELFEKARSEILDGLVNLSGISAEAWDSKLSSNLWTHLKGNVFRNIFEPAQMLERVDDYKTLIDIKLREWAERDLPQTSVLAGLETLYQQLDETHAAFTHSPGYDPLFDQLRTNVHRLTKNRHKLEEKAIDRLRVVQTMALEDRTVHSKAEWDAAVSFMEQAIEEALKDAFFKAILYPSEL
ncbi:unnamed protein product [Protopolystoma xenopodis]|uniref:Dynamin-like GTPase OPA1, mitochondrial n=1 Tax=Protopolystoma xenopodis TaxID=117903 RepID=A0A3S5CSY7_9PLAT|nr:unnamed protein product [Protopolystoma xenopodis]